MDSGEEPPLFIEVAEGQYLAGDYKEGDQHLWGVYASTLCAYQPQRGPDMLGYLYIIASAQHEFSLSACMSYDVAFRKKAAKFHLTLWGQLDPQIYACAFTGSDEVRPMT